MAVAIDARAADQVASTGDFGRVNIHGLSQSLHRLNRAGESAGILPMFMGLDARFYKSAKKNAIRAASLTVVAVIVGVRCWASTSLSFGISTASLQVSGGLLILLMALNMLNAQPGGARTTLEEAR